MEGGRYNPSSESGDGVNPRDNDESLSNDNKDCSSDEYFISEYFTSSEESDDDESSDGELWFYNSAGEKVLESNIPASSTYTTVKSA